MTAQHIGIILHDFSTGGSERIAIRLGNAWAKAGRRVTLYCGTENGALRALVSGDVAVSCCDPPIERGLVSRVRLALRLARSIRADQPDIVFVPGNYHLLVVAVLARFRFAKRPLFVCKLSNPVRSRHDPGLMTKVGEWLTRWALAPVTAFTAMSPALRAQALCVFTQHPIYDFAEPVLDDDLPSLTVVSHGDEPAKIICAGRLAPQKDFALALTAFSLIDPAHEARLVIYGEGLLQSDLTALANDLGISARVHFAGYVRDLRPHLAGAKLFLMTSQFEGYPAVLIEALAAGVPIVTTDCSPAIAEIVSSSQLGEVVSMRDPRMIAAAIERRLSADPPNRDFLIASTELHRMAKASRAYLDRFDALTDAAISSSSRQS